jgi:general stress protein 26
MSETRADKFLEVLKEFDTAILATINAQGEIHARPMAIFDIEEDGSVVFVTDESSVKVDEIERHPHATVIGQNGWTATVTLTGTASLFRDQARLREKWRKTFQAWFPDGPDDPRIVLVRVQAERGEYWDNSGVRAFRYMAQAARAVVTGTRPRIDEHDQHGKVRLN